MPRKLISLIFSDAPMITKPSMRRIMILLQAIFGLLWVEGASWKILVSGKLEPNYEGLAYWVSRGSEFPVLGAYKSVIDSLILPNIKLFLPGVFLMELTIGILFLIGKKIRLASTLALLQTTAITLSVLRAPHEWKWSYIMMYMFALFFFIRPTTSAWTRRLFPKK
jgi:thiosulfate dehydrogenase (quinone) large subunit